jgi:hypothetical protein
MKTDLEEILTKEVWKQKEESWMECATCYQRILCLAFLPICSFFCRCVALTEHALHNARRGPWKRATNRRILRAMSKYLPRDEVGCEDGNTRIHDNIRPSTRYFYNRHTPRRQDEILLNINLIRLWIQRHLPTLAACTQMGSWGCVTKVANCV